MRTGKTRERLQEWLCAGGGVLICALPVGVAWSSSGGIDGQFSAGCTGAGCHDGTGTYNYSLGISGPNSLTHGATGAFTINFNQVSGAAAARAGFNLFAANGTFSNLGTGVQTYVDSELTHDTPRSPSGGDFSWTYSWTAPSSYGTRSFLVCANPVDNNGSNLVSMGFPGDGAFRCTTRDVLVNNAPSISGVNSTTTFTEGGGSVVIDASVTASDDSPNLNRATVEITAGYVSGQDSLVCPVALPAAISCSFSAASATLTLSGTSSPANYSSALSSVRFNNNSQDPSTAQRTVAYQVRDQDNVLSGTDSTTLSVAAVNDAPVAVADARNASEDSTATYTNLEVNDTDVDDGTLYVHAVTSPSTQGGAVSINGADDVVYQPAANFCGSDSFTYRVRDRVTAGTAGVSLSNFATVTVTVACAPDAPLAVNDTPSVPRGSNNQALAVLANDTDPDNLSPPANSGLAVTSVAIVSPALAGESAVTGPSGGSITYTPPPDFSGQRILSYTVSDGALSDTAQVTVTVNAGTPPFAAADAPFTVAEDSLSTDGPNSFAVLANDSDDDGDTITIGIETLPANGVLSGDGGTVLTYQPNANFSGDDSFSYRAVDSAGLQSNEVTVAIVVTPASDSPVAISDVPSVARGSSANLLEVLANDTDPDNQSGPANTGLTVTAVEIRVGQDSVSGESAVPASAGAGVRYTPPSDFSGTRILDYTITDGSTTATAQITVTVLAGIAPVAVQDDPVTVQEDSSEAMPANLIPVLANDTDDDGDTLTAVVSAAPLNGTLFGSGTGTLRYRPNTNYTGADSFRYRAQDSAGLPSNEITVSITVTGMPDVPVAVSDADAVPRGSFGNLINVLANDTDADNLTGPANAGLTVTAASLAMGTMPLTGESVNIGPGGSGVSYTPPRNFSGVRNLVYTVSDGANTASAAVAVTVQASRRPVAAPDGPFEVDEDSLPSDLANGFNVLANDTDPDSDTLSISITQDAANGTLTGDGGNLLTYQPDPDFTGSDSFRYRTRDSAGLLSDTEITVAIIVRPLNDAPVAAIDSLPEPPVSFREDLGPFDLDVLANDSDVDAGDTRQITAVTPGDQGGSVTILGVTPNNRLRYTPAQNFNGIESFTYTVRDAVGSTAVGVVNVQILPVNDAPVITSTAVVSANDAQPYVYQLAQTDVDDTQFTYSLSGAPTSGSGMQISDAGLITWTPPISSSLEPYTVGPITVTVTDAGGSELPERLLSATQTFTITVNAPDRDGDGMPDSYELSEGFNPDNAADGALDRDGDGRSNADEYRAGLNPDADDVVPVLNVPAALTVDSTGYLTSVVLGANSASDIKDGALAVQGPNPPGPFRPGRFLIGYTARDAAGNTTNATQQLDVRPRVEFGADAVTGEGRTVTVPVTLNGLAPSYPVLLTYTVGGNAGGSDHDAAGGQLRIDSGSVAEIVFDVAADGSGEADETVVFTLTSASGAVLGARTTQTTTIIERNLPPQPTLSVTQMGEPRAQIFVNQGAVLVSATAVDPNPGDTLSFDYSGSDAALIPRAGNTSGFSFDPAALAPGTYTVRLIVRDAAGAASTVEATLMLRASPPALDTSDSDGDGVADNTEGFADLDGDGVPAYLDRFEDAFVVADRGGAMSRVLEAESGIGIRLGSTAIAASRSGAGVSAADVVAFGNGGGAADNGDDSFDNVGGLFDFELYGLAPGASASVVLPLQTALRPGAVWRKYAASSGWRDFVSDARNRVASAPSAGGQCPAPASVAYVSGLNALHACVRLTLEDGGPNDADGERNGRIRDPGGAAVPRASDPEPVPAGKSGGGALTLSALLALWLFAFLSLTQRRRRAA